jgi:hypothetical protein
MCGGKGRERKMTRTFYGGEILDAPTGGALGATYTFASPLVEDAGQKVTLKSDTNSLAIDATTGQLKIADAVLTSLAGKQATGDYATNAALTDGLATKQASGDYATNTALTNGLAGKQAADGTLTSLSGANPTTTTPLTVQGPLTTGNASTVASVQLRGKERWGGTSDLLNGINLMLGLNRALNRSLMMTASDADASSSTNTCLRVNLGGVVSVGAVTTDGLTAKPLGCNATYLDFVQSNIGAPTTRATSAGCKLRLFAGDQINTGDYAVGVEGNNAWFQVPTANAANGFKWYADTTQVGRLDGLGKLALTNMATGSGAELANLYQAGLTSGGMNYVMFGQSSSAKNCGVLQFTYAGAGSNSNSVGIGLSGLAPHMVCYADGTQGFPGSFVTPASGAFTFTGTNTWFTCLNMDNASLPAGNGWQFLTGGSGITDWCGVGNMGWFSKKLNDYVMNLDTLGTVNAKHDLSVGGNAKVSGFVDMRGIANAPPTRATSAGCKLRLFAGDQVNTGDYAVGVEASNAWFQVPTANTTNGFKWYADTTQVARLDGLGNLTTSGNISAMPAAGKDALITASVQDASKYAYLYLKTNSGANSGFHCMTNTGEQHIGGGNGTLKIDQGTIIPQGVILMGATQAVRAADTTSYLTFGGAATWQDFPGISMSGRQRPSGSGIMDLSFPDIGQVRFVSMAASGASTVVGTVNTVGDLWLNGKITANGGAANIKPNHFILANDSTTIATQSGTNLTAVSPGSFTRASSSSLFMLDVTFSCLAGSTGYGWMVIFMNPGGTEIQRTRIFFNAGQRTRHAVSFTALNTFTLVGPLTVGVTITDLQTSNLSTTNGTDAFYVRVMEFP